MTIRTTASTVSFAHPFMLAGMDRPFPPGTYQVETDEELLDGLSFYAFRRVSTSIHLTRAGITEVVVIDPAELDAALVLDRAKGPPPRSVP
jgi:hypothetical protein